jgi:cysteine desulfurase/selenocysteine lyase
MPDFDVKKIREDFPILKRFINGKPLIYFDNAATTQKPQYVLDSVDNYYKNLNSNVHRGVHTLSEEATNEYESARESIRKYINAGKSSEIIFVRGTTEAINLVASSFGSEFFNAGDEIIISAIEHHSNIVPWQMLCERKNAKLKVIPVDDGGEILIDEYKKLLTEKTKLVSVVHISNALGTQNPVKEIIQIAHNAGVPVMIDGAQSIQHSKIDVRELDVDFFAFSGHKVYAHTGIGVLYGKESLLNKMPPYHGGGEMIKSVSFEKTIYNDLPYKFEAGTPNIEGPISLKSAFEYIENIGLSKIEQYEDELLEYATNRLSEIKNIRFIGTAKEKKSVVSFLCGDIHPYDTGTILNNLGIAVRTGHHCAEPVMKRFNIPGTVRASFSFYNTKEEIDLLIEGIIKANKMLS